MAEYRSASPHIHYLAILLDHHTEVLQINIFNAGHLATGNKTCRRGIVCHYADQIELEVLVARINDFDRRHHIVRGSQHIANVAARPPQWSLGNKGYLRFNFGVNQLSGINHTAVRHAEIVREKAVNRCFYAHLRHFGPGCQAHFQPNSLVASGFLAPTDFPLHVISIGKSHARVIVGDLSDVLPIQLGVLHVFG